jgi:hypothetical protein
MEVVLYLCAKLIMRWALLCKQEDSEKLEVWESELERRSARPPRLEWVPVSESLASDVVEQRSGAWLDGEYESGMESEQMLSVCLFFDRMNVAGNAPDVRNCNWWSCFW